MAQLGIVDEILQKFRNIDEYWRTNKNDHRQSAAKPFPLDIAENPLEESEVKIELLETEADNSAEYFHQEITNTEEKKVSPNFIGLHIEKVESVVPEFTSLYYCYICERSNLNFCLILYIFHINLNIQVSQTLQASTDIVPVITNSQAPSLATIVTWCLEKKKQLNNTWQLIPNSGVNIAPNYSKIRKCST